MKNILFTSVVDSRLNYSIIDTVIKAENVDSVSMIICQKEQLDKYHQLGECFLRENIAKGKYDKNDLLSLGELEAIDDSVLNYIQPFSLEIFEQQRRFEEYHAFTIPCSYESHYNIYMNNILFWYNFLKKRNITHLFLTSLPHEGYDRIIYHLCKMLGIQVRMIYNSTLPFREYVLEDYNDSVTVLEEEYHRLLEQYKDCSVEEIPLDEEAKGIFDRWSSLDAKAMTPWYMRTDPLKRRFGIRFGQLNLFREWYDILGRGYRKAGMKKNLGFILQEIKDIPLYIKAIGIVYKRWSYARPIWKRTLELNSYYESIAEMPVDGEKYIYFALHYQPEASSNPQGGFYFDQRIPVRILSECVPDDVKIYVKSHPEQLAPFRSKEYYDELAAMRNVRIIKQDCGTFDLIKKSIAVSSLTGTVCWESQFYNIPAILFGHSQKNVTPLAYCVKTKEECRSALGEIQNAPKKVTLKQLKLFTKAMYNTSFGKENWDEKVTEIILDFLRE